MCGIAGFYIKDPNVIKNHAGVERFTNKLFLGNEKRGKHASGFVAMDWAGNVVFDKAAEAASDFIKSREPMPHDPRWALIHTRYATQGDPENHVNNHPVLHGTCFTTHNGRVENDDDLFTKYGFDRIGEVDSEILPALIGKANFDPEQIKALFKDVEGPIACATVDPVNHPDKVLLVRTKGSPLNIIDTPKFILWASLTETMKDAWGSVLGTPPKYNRFKFVPEYRCLLITPEGYTTFDLDRPPTPVVNRPEVHKPWEVARYTGYQRELPNGPDACSVDDDDKVHISKAEVKRAVTRLRVLKEGITETWDNCKARYGERWIACPICDELVKDDKDNYIQTLTRGRMCLDCSREYTRIYREKAEAIDAEAIEEKDEEEGYFDPEQYLSKNALNRLDRWAEDEDMAHGKALDALADITGMDNKTLDFLMFRFSPTDKTPGHVVDMITKLWEMYDEEYEAEWGTMWPSAKESYRVFLGEKISVAEVTKGKAPEPAVVNNAAPKRPKKCMFCKKKVKHRLVAPITEWHSPGYCTAHFTVCSTKGCTAKANHTRKDGLRVCHSHARGVSECLADKQLTDKGYQFAEVQ